MMNGLSILILTLDEERNLSDCLDSVSWCDDIVVFDSYSTDDTLNIARKAGVRVFQRKFDNYANQRNAALNDVSFKYPWVLMIDADERVSNELKDEIKSLLSHVSTDVTLFRVRRKDYFLGRWIRRSCGYPTWFGRLIRIGHVKVEREINEIFTTDGKIGFLNEHLVHYPFNKGITYWLERHNRYSSMEAVTLTNETHIRLTWNDIFSKDPVIRRKFLKQLVYRLPGRPIFIFFFLYVVRMGFLDGKAGLTFCLLRCIYEFMIDFKILEQKRIESNSKI